MCNQNFEISVIIVNYYLANMIQKHIYRLFNENVKLEIIIVDNSVDKHQKKILKQINFPVKIIYNTKNVGFAKACNQGVKIANAPYIFFLNPDAYIVDKCLFYLLDAAKKLHADAVGPKIFLDDNLQIPQPPFYSPLLFPKLIHNFFPKIYSTFWEKYSLTFWRKTTPFQISFLSGAAFLIKKELAVFDENFFMYFEDADLFLRLKKKQKKVFLYPQAKVIHYFNVTPNKKKSIFFHQSQIKFYQKHYPFLKKILFLSEQYKRTYIAPHIYFLKFLEQNNFKKDYIDVSFNSDFIPFVRIPWPQKKLPNFLVRHKKKLLVKL